MSYVFDRATALTPSGAPGSFAGVITRDYWIVVGPNGGYLAAIALRGATAALADASRAPRSLHVRYLSAPKEGDFELHTSVVREGRSMTILAVSMRQAGREFLTASVCFSAAFQSVSFQDRKPPNALPLADAIPMTKSIAIHQRFDSRVAIGAAPRSGAIAETGGYIRYVDGRPIDTLALAALWDSWPPALFYRATDPAPSAGVPTVEASVYFRRQVPFEGFRADDHVLLHTRSVMAHDGFVEEDAELWSLDGHLLVQSRQLALCR